MLASARAGCSSSQRGKPHASHSYCTWWRWRQPSQTDTTYLLCLWHSACFVSRVFLTWCRVEPHQLVSSGVEFSSDISAQPLLHQKGNKNTSRAKIMSRLKKHLIKLLLFPSLQIAHIRSPAWLLHWVLFNDFAHFFTAVDWIRELRRATTTRRPLPCSEHLSSSQGLKGWPATNNSNSG